MIEEIKNILNFIIIFQCCLFSIYLFSEKGTARLRNYLLGFFLVVIALAELNGVFTNFLELRDSVIVSSPYLLYFPIPFFFIYVPLLYLYILSITVKDFSLQKKHLLHFILPVIILLAIILQFITTSSDEIRKLLTIGCPFLAFETWLVRIAEYLQFIGYSIASIIILRKYRDAIKNEYSSIEKINLNWLTVLLIGVIGWNLLRISEIVLRSVLTNGIESSFYIISEIIFITLISIIFLKSLKQPQLFKGIEEKTTSKKYEKTLLTEKELAVFQSRIKDFVINEKPYLNPTISLSELSDMVSIPTHDLSQVLNTGLNQSFFDFINLHRIEDVKKYLSDSSFDNMSITEIMFECGFNSKSSFNNAFKKFTGKTPTEFREENIRLSA